MDFLQVQEGKMSQFADLLLTNVGKITHVILAYKKFFNRILESCRNIE